VAPSIRKKLALTSPTSGGRSVGIVRSRTQAMEFSFPLLSSTIQKIQHGGMSQVKHVLQFKKDFIIFLLGTKLKAFYHKLYGNA
jgi:hypothetical protein